MSVVSEYRAIRKALMNQISRLRRQGYEVDIEVPKIPKRPTKGSIQRLKKIKDDVWSHVSYKGAKGYGAKRKRAQERAAQRPKKPRKPKEPKKPEEPIPETEPDQEPGPEPKPETEPEPEPEQESIPETEPEIPGEPDSEDEEYYPQEAEIILNNILDEIGAGLDSKNKAIRKNAEYVQEQLFKAINDTDQFTFMENLAETDPEALQEAQSMIWDSTSQFVAQDMLTHHWYRLLKFGELLTEAEARGTEQPSYPEEGENWNDGSWENLLSLGDIYGKYNE